MTWTASSGISRMAARPARTKCDFCVPLQQVTLPSLISTREQAGPMLEWDWNGHSYSASLTRAAVVPVSRGPHRTSARRCLADVIVERSLIGERRRGVRPDHLELLRRLDGVPLLVGDDAEEALVPDHFGGRDIFDRAFVDAHRHGTGDRRTDHAGMDHAGHCHVGAEILLRKNFRSNVFALDRLAADLVILGLLRLRLAGRGERFAVFAVPVEVDVEIAPADEL